MTDLPDFVDFGANPVQTAIGPSRGSMVAVAAFVQATESKLHEWCEAVLRVPPGTDPYEPASDKVLLSIGTMTDGASTSSRTLSGTGPSTFGTAPHSFDEMGVLTETQLGIWIPLKSRRGGIGTAAAVPYMVVDNPLSLTIGREVNGFPKSMGRFTELLGDVDPTGDAERLGWHVEAYGGRFGQGAQAGWTPLLSFEKAPPGSEPDDVPPPRDRSVKTLLAAARKAVADAYDAAVDAVTDLTSVHVPFLRQVRSSADPSLAAYQELCEAPISVTTVPKVVPRGDDHLLTFHDVSSAPIAAELGIDDQRVGMVVDVEVGIELGLAETVWSTGPEP